MYIDSILMFNRYVKVLFMCLNKMMMFILTISLLPLEIFTSVCCSACVSDHYMPVNVSYCFLYVGYLERRLIYS